MPLSQTVWDTAIPVNADLRVNVILQGEDKISSGGATKGSESNFFLQDLHLQVIGTSVVLSFVTAFATIAPTAPNAKLTPAAVPFEPAEPIIVKSFDSQFGHFKL